MWHSVMTWRGRMGGGERAQHGKDVCVMVTDSRCCTAETYTTL